MYFGHYLFSTWTESAQDIAELYISKLEATKGVALAGQNHKLYTAQLFLQFCHFCIQGDLVG